METYISLRSAMTAHKQFRCSSAIQQFPQTNTHFLANPFSFVNINIYFFRQIDGYGTPADKYENHMKIIRNSMQII